MPKDTEYPRMLGPFCLFFYLFCYMFSLLFTLNALVKITVFLPISRVSFLFRHHVFLLGFTLVPAYNCNLDFSLMNAFVH